MDSELEQSLLQAVASSPLYRPWLPTDGKEQELRDSADPGTDGNGVEAGTSGSRGLAELHDRIAKAGGTRKQQCFALDNITQADHFASTYRGITSGRSGQRFDYRKGQQWIEQRDRWRRSQLRQRADGNYAVINVASRLFPHDPFDITLVCADITPALTASLQDILAHLREQDLHVFWRGFPARLLENLGQIRSLCDRIGMRRSSVISTGAGATAEQQRILCSVLSPGGLVDEYGAQDCGIQLYSCPACGCFHASNPRCLLSVERGQLYATDLYSHSQPVVAMATGDLAVIHDGVCPVTDEAGFVPRPIPALQSHDHAGIARQRHDATARHRPFILTAPHADPTLLNLRAAAGLQPQEPAPPASGQRPGDVSAAGINELVELAGRGAIALCRERLGQHLSRSLLARFAGRQTSLIDHLIGQLVLVDLSTWEGILRIWLSAEASQPGAGSDAEALLRQTLAMDIRHAHRASADLLGVCGDTTELLVTILGDPTPAGQLISQTGLSRQVDPLLHRLAGLSGDDRPLALPIVSACSDLLLAHCWRKDRRLMEWLAAAFRGSEDGGIHAAEAMHRAGLLRKL